MHRAVEGCIGHLAAPCRPSMVLLCPKIPLLSVVPHPVAKCLADQCCLHSGLGLGRTLHSEPAKDGEVTRKGISCERTFAAISSREDLEAKVGTAALQAAVHRVPLVMDCLSYRHSRHGGSQPLHGSRANSLVGVIPAGHSSVLRACSTSCMTSLT